MSTRASRHVPGRAGRHAPFCCARCPDKHNVVLTDIATGASLQFSSPIGSLTSSERRFRVEQRALSSDDHAHIISALRVLFRASIETGNPGALVLRLRVVGVRQGCSSHRAPR